MDFPSASPASTPAAWVWTLPASGIQARMQDTDLHALASVCPPRTYRRGDHVYRLGDAADDLYVLIDGSVKLSAPARLGGELAIQQKPSRKTHTGTTIPRTAEFPNHVWTYDLIFDQPLGGPTLNILTLTDEFTRPSLAIRVAEAFTSVDVKAVLDEGIKESSAPTLLRSDTGSEFIARDLASW